MVRLLQTAFCGGAVVCTGGVWVVGAGVWPSEGIYVYAVDAATGFTNNEPVMLKRAGIDTVVLNGAVVVRHGRFDRTTRVGQVLRRFGPETFHTAFWCDLAFQAGSDRLLVFPRSWTCRGLAARGFLPMDDGACTLYALTIGDGAVKRISFPDTIASVAVSKDLIAVSC